MENIPVTAYSGFSNVRGEITLRKVIENITTGIHAKSVSKIRLLVGQGKMEEANNVKKQLPFYTVTAGYREKRQAYSVIRYTHITLLDIDDQPEEKLEELRGKINGDPDTLASFLTPKGHGFKVFVFLKTDYATRLRATLAAKEKVGFSTLENITWPCTTPARNIMKSCSAWKWTEAERTYQGGSSPPSMKRRT